MATPFSRTTRALNADTYRRSTLGLIIVMAVLGAWTAWLFMARVAVYEVTDTARLEVDRAVHPVQSPVFGRIVASHLAIGKQVNVGDVLVELDSEAEQLQLGEEQARVEALSAQLEALRHRGLAERQSQMETQQGTPVVLDEARAKYEEAETVAQAAAEELRRLERLRAQGLMAEMDLLRAKSEAQKRRAAADALRLGISRMENDQRVKQSDRQVRIEAINGEMTALDGEINTKKATIERLQHEMNKRRIRATAAGRLGEVADLRTGSVVREGDKLGAIIPSGTLRVVAEFLPSAALGRIEPGQRAQLRLTGFPWTEYGSVAATVATVASEPRGGRVRVELTVEPNRTSPIPLQHGLPGTVEVEVNRVSPVALVLRVAGKLLAKPIK
jgi:membrane fusion protein (multidrug efflux system)